MWNVYFILFSPMMHVKFKLKEVSSLRISCHFMHHCTGFLSFLSLYFLFYSFLGQFSNFSNLKPCGSSVRHLLFLSIVEQSKKETRMIRKSVNKRNFNRREELIKTGKGRFTSVCEETLLIRVMQYF